MSQEQNQYQTQIESKASDSVRIAEPVATREVNQESCKIADDMIDQTSLLNRPYLIDHERPLKGISDGNPHTIKNRKPNGVFEICSDSGTFKNPIGYTHSDSGNIKLVTLQ